MKYFDKTDLGKIRRTNQDRTATHENLGNQFLAVLCDGMGGHQSGELAARIVCDYMIQCFDAMRVLDTHEEAQQWLLNSTKEANDMLYRLGSTNSMHHGMGTTMVSVLIEPQYISVVSVGDSRAYSYCDDTLTQITEDHSLVNMLVKTGSITREEAEHHPKKNVLMQAIGVKPELDILIINVEYKPQQMLICSDGLYNTISEQEIKEVLRESITVREKVYKLIQKANDNGGNDNIGIILVEIEKRDMYE